MSMQMSPPPELTPQEAAALAHVKAAEQAAAQIPVSAGVKPRDIERAAVISWPYRYGATDPAAIPNPYYGLFLQIASMSVVLRRYAARAYGILNCDIDYLRPARTVDTYATAEIVRRTRRTVLAKVVCWQSEDRVPVATGRVQILLDTSAASAAPSAAETSA